MKPATITRALAKKLGLAGKLPRHPLGLGVNTLPEFWLEVRPEGGWWILQRKQEGADDVILAVIEPSTVYVLQQSRTPLVLGAQ